MADWAVLVVVPQDGTPGTHEVYEARFGAVGLDLDLLAGPDVVLPAVRARTRVEGHWRDDGVCEAAVLLDLRRRILLLFASEGPVTQLRHRAVTLRRLALAWPGWEPRWAYDGLAGLRVHLGLDPDAVRERDARVFPETPLEHDDEEVRERDPYLRIVTVGEHRCHLLTAVNDHPVTEGAALLDRLAGAPRHGRCRAAVQSGLHIDPARRRIGWWLLGAVPRAGETAARWPGWTVGFWADRWTEHARAATGLFAPPRVHAGRALAELREEAAAHWAQRPGDGSWPGWMQAAVRREEADAVVERIRSWR
ncbi:hypothetical protein ACF05L_08475 [Streptomyces bobili]|uniref:hypothetical protein n=1 Tax=Streptomyces bobili TaxID=67280 RepID=UPI0036F6BBB9